MFSESLAVDCNLCREAFRLLFCPRVGKMNKSPKDYQIPLMLFKGLSDKESAAIVFLHRKISGMLHAWRQGGNIPLNDLEEIAEDATILVLRKIENGEFRYDGTTPLAYANVIAQNLLRNFLRKRQMVITEVQEWDASEDPSVEKYLYGKELQRLLAGALEKMPDNCRQLITLFHLEEKTDEETLQSGLTPYSTVSSLRSKRGECMKKLRALMEDLKKYL